MLPSIKKYFRKYFKSKPRKEDVGPNIPSDFGSSDAKSGRVTVLHERGLQGVSSNEQSYEYDAPPLYSAPLDSSHLGTPGSMALPDPPVSMNPSGSARRPRRAMVEPTIEISAASDDSTSSSDNDSLKDSESDVQYTKGNYRRPNDHRRPQQAQDYQRTSLPREHRASTRDYDTRGPRNTSHLASDPGRVLDATFGPGGTFDAVFGQGGTFDTVFGTGGTYRPTVYGGHGRRPTQGTRPEGSSYANVNTVYESGNVNHWTRDYNSTAQESHGSLRDEEFNAGSRYARSEFQDRPAAQNNHWQQGGNYNNAFTQINPSVSWFANSRNVSITGPTNFQHYEIVHNHTPGNHDSTTVTQFRVN